MNRYTRLDFFAGEDRDNPIRDEIERFLVNPLWKDLNEYIVKACGARPQISYNLYAAERCWNVEYHLNGKVICTLYPGKDDFEAMIVITNAEEKYAEPILAGGSAYLRKQYESTRKSPLGRWLILRISERKVLLDAEALIGLRIRFAGDS
jgi:hypothetical protein